LLLGGEDAKARAAEGQTPSVLRDAALIKPGNNLPTLFVDYLHLPSSLSIFLSHTGLLLGGEDAKARAAEGKTPSVLRDAVLLRPGTTPGDLLSVLKRPPWQVRANPLLSLLSSCTYCLLEWLLQLLLSPWHIPGCLIPSSTSSLTMYYQCSWHWHTCKLAVIITTTTILSSSSSSLSLPSSSSFL
jgi:hypothetical protein